MPAPSSSPRKPLKRSKNGCLACKQKRKKCDEGWPCSRCIQAGIECMRAPERTVAPVIRFVIDTRVHDKLRFHSLDFEGKDTPADSFQISPSTTVSSPTPPSERQPFMDPIEPAPDVQDSIIMMSHCGGSERSAPVPSLCANLCNSVPDFPRSATARMKHSSMQFWEYAQDYGPRVIWPPAGPAGADQFDPEEAIPVIQQSIAVLDQNALIEPVFREICYFYETFLNRVIFDYALAPDKTVGWMLQRFNISDSVKLGMLCTAVLFRSNYERSILALSLRSYEEELYTLALKKLPFDLCDPNLSSIVKLTALTEIMNYEFYAGKLSNYYAHGAQAVPLVRALVGSNNIDLMSLWGKQTFDVRCFAWCDIFDSLATSRPTHFTYESDLELANVAVDDKGVESIYGCPDVIAVLLARTTALRHARISAEERTQRGIETEGLVRTWQFGPARARHSHMRVARVAVQEIWRHAAILYVHHAIFKSHSSNLTVRDSVKTIIKVSSTIQPGGNPDCFLQAAYFIAGTFATLEKDRYTLKGRILGSGNERYLRDLATALEEIWEETDKTGRLTTWSKKPESFVF